MHVYTYICGVIKKTQKQKAMKTRSILLAAALLAGSTFAQAQTKADGKKATTKTASQPSKWNNDPTHSSIKFTVSHLTVSEVEGRFKTFTGTIETPGDDFNNASITFTADVNSITTEDNTRDNHLKSDDFFNAEKYPQMTFKSTSFKKMRNNIYSLEGDLTIRDVTKHVTFAVLYGGTVTDPWGNVKAGFKATGKVSRKAFGLKWNKLTEAGGAVVGDEVNIILNLEFAKQKA
jgi:polyisoprenoid-binding protein YceI